MAASEITSRYCGPQGGTTMDGQQFDAIARAWGTRGTRRLTMQALTIAVGRVWLETARVGAGCQKSGKKCASKNECCSKRCTNGHCECRDLWQTCKRNANCCSGKRACSEITTFGCGLPGKRCCLKLQATCTGDDCECCGKTFCAPNACFQGGDVCCKGLNAHCTESCDCCGALLCKPGGCSGGGLRCCAQKGEMCQANCECCGSLACVSGACQ